MPKTITREELDALVKEHGVTVIRKRSEAERLAKSVSLDLELRFHALSKQVDRLDELLEKGAGDREDFVALCRETSHDVAALRKDVARVAEELEALQSARRPTWEFDVQRDGNGKIAKVIAKPTEGSK